MIDVPEPTQRRRDRKTCTWCEASAAGCGSNEWLRARRCCEACSGDHDADRSGVDSMTAERRALPSPPLTTASRIDTEATA